jgi:uncharacterized membrane protein
VKSLQSATLLTATVATGLIAGLMFAYACSVMPALGRSSDRTFVETMRNINKAIINGWFMLPFAGAIPLIILALILAWRGYGRAALPWIAVALVLYVVAFAVTSGFNVPLNNRLEKAGGSDQLAREHFENAWVAWNIVRTVVHTAAFGCLAWALVVHGADRDRPHAGAAQPPGTAHRPYPQPPAAYARQTTGHRPV